MSLVFQFKRIHLASGGIVYRPTADVVIQWRRKEVEVPMIIDSGADVCAIPRNQAIELGIDVPRRKQDVRSDQLIEMRGIAGRAVYAIEKHLTMVLLSEDEMYPLRRVPVRIPLMETGMPALLGRRGVFNRFVIVFDREAGQIVFRPK